MAENSFCIFNKKVIYNNLSKEYGINMMSCEICKSDVKILTVGKSPISGYTCKTIDESLSQPSFEMNLLACPNCSMVKYQWFDEAEAILDRLYSGHFATYYFTKKMSEYMNSFIDSLSSKYNLNKDSSILELGCNSGRMLNMFREKINCTTLGVEPSKTFNSTWKDMNIEVINDYFGESVAETLKDKNFDLIYFRHVFEHIPDPVSFIKSVASVASNDSIVVIEVPYLASVINNKRIENISYSHLNYFTIQSIDAIATKYNFGIIDFQLVETDGGSIVVHLQKNKTTNPDIIDNITISNVSELVSHISNAKDLMLSNLGKYDKQEVIGYGAGAKGQHLLHILGLEEYVSYVIDDTPELKGSYIPGTSVEIKSLDQVDRNVVKAVINLIPTHAEAIKEKLAGQFEFIDPINI